MNKNNAWGQPGQPSKDPSTQGMRPVPRKEQAWGTPSPNSSTVSTTAASSTGEHLEHPNSSRRNKRIVFLVISVLAVLALVGGLAWALVNRNDTNGADDPNEPALATSSEAKGNSHSEKGTASDKHEDNPKKGRGKETPREENNAESQELNKYEKCNEHADNKLSDLRSPVKIYCDDSWLFAGEDGTANLALFYWTNNAWHSYRTDRILSPSDMGCYDRSKLEDAGAPRRLLDEVLLCDDNADAKAESSKETTNKSGAEDEFAWAGGWDGKCDGRYILIVESVLISSGEPFSETSRVQDKYPGSKILYGGACSSLRSQVNGNDVYAIYFDAGHSVDKVCALKAQYGGNARSLNNDADFSDPC